MERLWSSLRERLRGETRRSHDMVDAAFLAHDITVFGGYTSFLLAHQTVLQSLSISSQNSCGHTLLSEIELLLGRVRADLMSLGECALVPDPPDGRAYDPTALDYVLLGSRLGMAVLRKTWSRSSDPAVLSTAKFLSTPPEPIRWRAFCKDLSAMPASGAKADTIIADAHAIFASYARAADRAAKPSTGDTYAADVRIAAR